MSYTDTVIERDQAIKARLEKEITLFKLRNPTVLPVIIDNEAIYVLTRRNHKIPYAVPQWGIDSRQSHQLVLDYGISTIINVADGRIKAYCAGHDSVQLESTAIFSSTDTSRREQGNAILSCVLDVAIKAAQSDRNRGIQRFSDCDLD